MKIKTPASYDERFGDLSDSSGESIGYDLHQDYAREIVQSINNHDALLQSLRDMVEIVGANFCSSQDVKRKYKIARELLEQNK